MANNASNVAVGKPKAGGAIFVAPSGTTAPTDATTALAEAFKCLGYVSEDGVTHTTDTDSSDIPAWGGDNVLTVQTSFSESFSFTLIETNADVLKAIYGASNVTVGEDGAITVKHKSGDRDEGVYVIEVVMGSRVKRIVVPRGKITEIGDITYKDDEAIGYEVTLTALVDTDGAFTNEYIAAVKASE